MAEIEKVIEAVEGAFDLVHSDFIGTYDFDETEWKKNKADALELLKKQEAVEPIPPIDDSDLWRCGNCGHQMFRVVHQLYCQKCGRAVKWK